MANEISLEHFSKPVLGISSRRYRQLADENIVPSVSKGQVDALLACKQYIDYQRTLIEGQGSLSLTDERTRLTRINADRKELELKKEQGLLISVEISMTFWGNVLSKIRSKLLSMPKKLSPLIIGMSIVQAEKKTDLFIREVLNELAEIDPAAERREPRIRSPKGRIANAKAAAKIKRKPVGGKQKDTKRGSKRRAR